jgi:hypothetical protein
MTKAEVLALVDVKSADIAADLVEIRLAVDSIVEGDNSALLQRIADLEVQVADLQARLVACEDKIAQIRLIVA